MRWLLLMLWGGLTALPAGLAMTWAISPGRTLVPEFLLGVWLGGALAAGLWARLWLEAATLGWWRLVLGGWLWGSVAALLSGLGVVAVFVLSDRSDTPVSLGDVLSVGGTASVVGLIVGWRYGVIPLLGPLWVWGLGRAAKRLGLR